MAAGKPVAATHLPGIVKEFGDNNGVLYVERPEDTLNNVVQLMENGYITTEGKKAKHFVEKNNWFDITTEFAKILESAIGGIDE
jgi:glycosyltransferase involved in cell wall biosynthesis